ncbi:hypothetical protein [uncultured Ruminococcus sp.]|uniref:hypothetical protein n=1 Tax=uncultured Ruminococcus sp. TaxID=165186 RepID=UPI0025E629A7|nr:hypothetical protein [uncultured Ruminococcus sp.]
MVKGVNKNIIEINNPDSIYFEKAVLYVRPNVTVFPEAVRRKETERLLNRLLPDKKTGKGRRIKRFIILSLISDLCLLILLLMR